MTRAAPLLFATDPRRLGILFIATAMIAGLVTLGVTAVMSLGTGPASLGTAHGVLITLFVLIPVLLGGFGNALLPTRIGAKGLAFPRLSNLTWWLYILALGCAMTALFSGTVWPWGLIALVLIGISQILGAIIALTTFINMRAMPMAQAPVFAWAVALASAVILVSTPVVAAASLVLMAETTAPETETLRRILWIIGQPQMVILALPALGLLAEIGASEKHWPRQAMVTVLGLMALVGTVLWMDRAMNAPALPDADAMFRLSAAIITPAGICIAGLWLAFWRNATLAPGILGGGIVTATLIGTALAMSSNIGADRLHAMLGIASIFAAYAGFQMWFGIFTGRAMAPRAGAVQAALAVAGGMLTLWTNAPLALHAGLVISFIGFAALIVIAIHAAIHGPAVTSQGHILPDQPSRALT
ncbi:cbb3-type cytochrome c oxidase subunit I [Falsirhodobacter sp. alg1]|uniref:cbb3-type cytochrome c oxidase subunit I n=1 Tax=Falsirhodobacter sp. alg1 TaxID=1472418 RepID=UPI0005EF46C3|nr:cbb3-type cytochrome c oxidase subunit I [Falsirhodobacter sp. alg1]